jgi:hypothetical protein
MKKPSKGSSKSKPKPLTPQEKLALAQQKQDLWSKVAADPGQTPESAAAASQLSRSWGAAALLAQKALAPPPAPQDPNSPDPFLGKLLGMDQSPEPQQSSSPTPDTSTKPETFGSIT